MRLTQTDDYGLLWLITLEPHDKDNYLFTSSVLYGAETQQAFIQKYLINSFFATLLSRGWEVEL